MKRGVRRIDKARHVYSSVLSRGEGCLFIGNHLPNPSQTLGFLQKLPFWCPISRPPGFFHETLLAVWAGDRMTLGSPTTNRTPPENGFCGRQLVPDASVVFIERIENSAFSFPLNLGIEPDFLSIRGRDTEDDTSKM